MVTSMVSFVLALLLVVCPVAAAGPVMVSGNPNLPPISWEKRGKLLGVGPELADRILGELGLACRIAPAGSWQAVQEKTLAGELDMIVAAYDNAARRIGMKFSNPYLDSPVVIVVKKGNGFPVTSWQSLKGRKGVAHEGESFGERFDAFIRKELDVRYLPYEGAFAGLADGTADYLVIDLYPAIIYAKLLQAEDKVEFLARPVTVQKLHLAVSKHSALARDMERINTVLERLKKEKVIRKLVLDQYAYWNRTLAERDRFLARQQAQASKQQAGYRAASRDLGMERLLRFLDQEYPLLDGGRGLDMH